MFCTAVTKLALAAAAAAVLTSASSCGTPTAVAQGKPPPCDCVPEFPPVALPAVVPWNGAPLAIGPNTVIILYPDGQPAANYVAYRVEWPLQQIPEAVLVPSGKLPAFVDSSILATILIRFPNPPPPPVVPDPVEMLIDAFRADDDNPIP